MTPTNSAKKPMKYKGLLSITVAIRLPWDFESKRSSIFLPPKCAWFWIRQWHWNVRDYRNRSRKDFRKRAEVLRKLLERDFLPQFAGSKEYSLESLTEEKKFEKSGKDRYMETPCDLGLSKYTVPISLRFNPKKKKSIHMVVITDDVDHPVNEFIINPKEKQPQSNPYAVRNFIGHIIGIRRSQLYHPAAAIRRHNIFLPPGELSVKINKQKRFIVVAYLSFFRNPDCVRVRRTFTFNTVFVPVESDDKPATISIDEVRSFMESLGKHPADNDVDGMELTGDLCTFLYGQNGKKVKCTGLRGLGRELVRQLPPFYGSEQSCGNDVTKRKRKRNEQISGILRNQLSASVTGIAVLATVDKDVDGGAYEAWSNGEEKMLSGFYMAGLPGNRNRSCLEKEFNEDGTERARSYFGYLKNYSAAGCVLSVSDGHKEEFPKWSVLWNFGWYAHLVTALASAKQLIQGFHHELDKRPRGFRTFLALSEEFTTDFDEGYGLDLKVNQYKQQHQRVLAIARLGGDRRELDRELSKFSESQGARNMHWMTRWLLILTVVLAVVAIGTFLIGRAS